MTGLAPSEQPGATWRQALPAAVLFGLLCLVLVHSEIVGHTYYLELATRIMIFGLAAVGLNLILGYGGLVSFGHALYLGVGAYTVAILAQSGVDSGLVQLLVALAVAVVISVLTGYVSLKVSGMGFIMITLAFTQMFYFLMIGLKQYGGDEGLSVDAPTRILGLDLSDPYHLFGLSFVLLAVVCFLAGRLVHSRFGMVIRGARQNDRRMYALGFPAMRYQLCAYVISAMVVAVAGVLLANLSMFSAPSYMNWTMSGDLILMCVLGGLGSLLGPLVGAAVFVGLEEFLSTMPIQLPGGWNDAITTHWMGFFGVFIVLAVIFMHRGIYGFFVRQGAGRE